VQNGELVNASSLIRLLFMRTGAGPKTRLANAPRAEGQGGVGALRNCHRMRRPGLNAKPPLSFREQYGPKSSAWTEGHFPPIVQFWTDDGSCWGVPFHQVIAVNYSPRAQTLFIHCSVGSILVTGPQAKVFLERFCEHKVALVKADGKDILRVSLVHQQGKGEE